MTVKERLRMRERRAKRAASEEVPPNGERRSKGAVSSERAAFSVDVLEERVMGGARNRMTWRLRHGLKDAGGIFRHRGKSEISRLQSERSAF